MFTSINKIIKDAKKGKMFILVDDENRENEGDLIIPANKIKRSKREIEINLFQDKLLKYSLK